MENFKKKTVKPKGSKWEKQIVATLCETSTCVDYLVLAGAKFSIFYMFLSYLSIDSFAMVTSVKRVNGAQFALA